MFGGNEKFQIALVNRCYRPEYGFDRLLDRRLYGFVCKNVELETNRQCFRCHAYVSNEGV